MGRNIEGKIGPSSEGLSGYHIVAVERHLTITGEPYHPGPYIAAKGDCGAGQYNYSGRTLVPGIVSLEVRRNLGLPPI